MKFRYKKLSSNLTRPIIPIGISYKGGTPIRYEALIDSGADMCAFDAQIGEILGIDIQSGRKDEFAGVMGDAKFIFYHEVVVTIGGWPYRIDAGFAYDISPYGFGFLGQNGFFDKFVVQFDYPKTEIILRQPVN